MKQKQEGNLRKQKEKKNGEWKDGAWISRGGRNGIQGKWGIKVKVWKIKIK